MNKIVSLGMNEHCPYLWYVAQAPKVQNVAHNFVHTSPPTFLPTLMVYGKSYYISPLRVYNPNNVRLIFLLQYSQCITMKTLQLKGA